MRAAIASLLSAIVAALLAWSAQQLALIMDPTVGTIARNCIGTAVFALVLLACLVAVRLHGDDRVEW